MQALPNKASDNPEQNSNQYRFVIGGLVLLCHLALGMNLFSASPVLPLIIDEYAISRSAAGLMVTLALFFAAVFGLPGGVIISRIGAQRAFTIGYWLMALIALSPLAPNFISLLALRLAFGVGTAFLLTATGPLMMQWFKPREILVMNAFNTAALSLGIALSVSTAAPLANWLGWSMALGIFGLAGVAGAFTWTLLARPVVKASSLASTPVTALTRKEIWSVISHPAVLLLVAADGGVLLQYTALTSWLPTFFNEVRDMSLSRGGFITGILPFVGLFAVLAGGILPSRFGLKPIFFVAPGILIVVAGPGTFLSGNLIVIYASIVVLGIGSWLYVPTLLSLPMALPGMTPEKVGIVWGFIITVSGFCMFLSPLLVGAVRDIWGSFTPGFIVCGVAAWTLLLAGILMPRALNPTPAPGR